MALHFILMIATSLTSFTPGTQENETVVIQSVSVIDVEEGVAKPGLNVWIEGDRIVAIEDSKSDQGPFDGVELIDGRELFVIPGLWICTFT